MGTPRGVGLQPHTMSWGRIWQLTKSLGVGDDKYSRGQLGLWQQNSNMEKGPNCEGINKGKAGLSSQVTKDGTKDQNWGGQSGDLVTYQSKPSDLNQGTGPEPGHSLGIKLRPTGGPEASLC